MIDFTDDDLKDLIADDPEEFRRQIIKHPSFTDSCHRYHTEAQRLFQMTCGIDPESRQAQKDAQVKEVSESNSQRIAEIKSDPIWKDRLHPKHKELHREYSALHTQEGEEI